MCGGYRSDYATAQTAVIGLPTAGPPAHGPTPAESLLRAIEGAAEVRRRSQYFHWLLSYVSAMLPNQLAVCGAWHAGSRALVFEQFNSILLPEAVIADLVGPASALLNGIAGEWSRRGCEPCVMPLSGAGHLDVRAAAGGLLANGFTELLVHGVSRPQRSHEVETLFVFASPLSTIEPRHLHALELVGPHLHQTYLRVLAVESNLRQRTSLPAPLARAAPQGDGLLTRRELQILALIRDGMNNAEIGLSLAISPLTAKNHVQKLLRKLGAANRAQAVVRAMALGALEGADATLAAAALPANRAANSDQHPGKPN